jgi:hypothetical protein
MMQQDGACLDFGLNGKPFLGVWCTQLIWVYYVICFFYLDKACHLVADKGLAADELFYCVMRGCLKVYTNEINF